MDKSENEDRMFMTAGRFGSQLLVTITSCLHSTSSVTKIVLDQVLDLIFGASIEVLLKQHVAQVSQ